MQEHHPYEPLISVIIPFLNAAPYLDETLKSVWSQEYTNWEIILVDDGSTDDSLRVIEKWIAKHPDKIFVFQHPNNANRGAAASRNLGVSKAKGKVLAFLDADDLWLPPYLKEQLKLFEKYPDVTVICEGTKYWYSWSNPQLKDKIIFIGAPVDNVYDPPYLAKKLYPLGIGDSFCTCALMMYTDNFNRLGGFDESFVGNNQLFEDQVLFLKLCLKEKIYLSSNCNNIYRQRPNSLMHGLVSSGHYGKAQLFFLKWLEQYIDKNNIKDPQLHQLLKKAYFPYTYPLLYKVISLGSRIQRRAKREIKKLMKADR